MRGSDTHLIENSNEEMSLMKLSLTFSNEKGPRRRYRIESFKTSTCVKFEYEAKYAVTTKFSRDYPVFMFQASF